MKLHHDQINELLPEYTADTLSADDRAKVEMHLDSCPICREELSLWKSVAESVETVGKKITPQPNLVDRAIKQIRHVPARVNIPVRAWNILVSQLPIIKREIWPAAAGTMAIGYFAALLAGKVDLIRILAPLISAACISVLYGPEHDSAGEMTRSTPTSPRQILLARIFLVFAYNVALALAATLAISPFFETIQPMPFILSWLGPMALLSSLALLLSLVIGTGNAIIFAYIAWTSQFLYPGMQKFFELPVYKRLGEGLSLYTAFWQEPAWLLLIALGLITLTLWIMPRLDFRQSAHV
jgi:hypothetical protein